MSLQSVLAPLRAACVATLVLAFLCCGLYPAVVWVVGQWAFPAEANGSLVRDELGTVRGSRLIGQSFTGARYFHSRPSAAGAGYDPLSSGGSHLGPTSRVLAERLRGRVSGYRGVNSLPGDGVVPADAVTASGSGLDPHISVADARLQAVRVARARGLDEDRVGARIRECTERPRLWFLGEPGVNVLQLNLALDGPQFTP